MVCAGAAAIIAVGVRAVNNDTHTREVVASELQLEIGSWPYSLNYSVVVVVFFFLNLVIP